MIRLFLTVVFLSACSAVPIPLPTQMDVGVTLGCEAMQAAGCFVEVQAAFPGLDAQNCKQRVGAIIDGANRYRQAYEQNQADSGKALNAILSEGLSDVVSVGNWDPLGVNVSKLSTLKNARCKSLKKAIGVK